jgi:hypothetical protein
MSKNGRCLDGLGDLGFVELASCLSDEATGGGVFDKELAGASDRGPEAVGPRFFERFLAMNAVLLECERARQARPAQGAGEG